MVTMHPGEKRVAETSVERNGGIGGNDVNKKRARRHRHQSPEEKLMADFKAKIETAAKSGDSAAAIDAYNKMKDLKLPINLYLHRVVINVCAKDEKAVDVQDHAFKVYEDMQVHPDMASSKVRTDETVFSALIKICAKSRDFEKCRGLLGHMIVQQVEPRLRTFSPLLGAYADEGDLGGALWVHGQLKNYSIDLTEVEYLALLRVCTKTQSSDFFSRILAEYCDTILLPGPGAWNVLQEWFASDAAMESGRKWTCFTETIDANGISSVNGDRLESIELPEDQESALIEKIESLVMTDEKRIEQWNEFKEWLAVNGPFDVVLDAANIGYFNQNYEGGGFSYTQINLMVEHYESQGKRVLVVLHKRRTYDDVVPIEFHATLQGYRERNVMYNCRSGNNDDWYWLYAGVKLGGRTLVVTNDEMRDHHFQMIHTRALVRWKERHQVRYSIQSEKFVRVQEPSAYSARAQRIGESWHFPSSADPTQWLCFQLETAT